MQHPVPALSVAILLLTIALLALIWMQTGGPRYIAVDGDTIRDPKTKQTIRISNIDTPEMKAERPEERKAAQLAKARLQAILQSGDIKFVPDEKRKKDKYGRDLGRILWGGKDVGDILVAEKLARPYSGGKRQPW